MVIFEELISFGIKSVTYSEQTLILLDEESSEVILIRSAGRLVGGDRKFLTSKLKDCPAAMSAENRFETEILFWF